ncbi:MAG: flagellar biosynthetic protein FliO [Treponema sp.]|nr:flagellar biosynthetic protein FliO [Treponema sp.]
MLSGIGLSAQTQESQVHGVGQAVEAPGRLGERALVLGEGVDEPVPVQGRVSFFLILRMILVLALVAVAIYGIVFFLKRVSRPLEQKNPHLKVLARVHVGAGVLAAVVSVGSKAWLVGAGEGGVSLIAEVTDQETIDAMLVDESRKSAETGTTKLLDFSQVLRRLGGGGVSATQGIKAENVRKRRERLRGL